MRALKYDCHRKRAREGGEREFESTTEGLRKVGDTCTIGPAYALMIFDDSVGRVLVQCK